MSVRWTSLPGLVSLIFVGSLVPPTAAQNTSSAAPSFEVASVRKVTSGDGVISVNFDPERFSARGSLRLLIAIAYELQQNELVGGPAWIDRESFDIVATAPGVKTASQMRLMLQALLADRFKLAIHREDRMAQTFDLLVADAKIATSAIVATRVDCAALGPNPQPVPPTSKAWCGIRGTGRCRLTAQGGTIEQFARMLTAMVGGPVTNQTQLSGQYDFEFAFCPGQSSADADVPLATALRDQLGLRLDGARRSVQVVVIDRAELPTEN